MWWAEPAQALACIKDTGEKVTETQIETEVPGLAYDLGHKVEPTLKSSYVLSFPDIHLEALGGDGVPSGVVTEL